MQLMMRPRFPCFYRECDQPDAQIISGMIAIINDEWEVGNLVDWWSDGCFWSGRIAAILDNDMVQAFHASAAVPYKTFASMMPVLFRALESRPLASLKYDGREEHLYFVTSQP
eukprot:Gb_23344 [translate_table: standard]